MIKSVIIGGFRLRRAVISITDQYQLANEQGRRIFKRLLKMVAVALHSNLRNYRTSTEISSLLRFGRHYSSSHMIIFQIFHSASALKSVRDQSFVI